MELIKSARRKTAFSEAVYISLNVLLPVVLLLSVRSFDTLLIALTIVFLSKWRVLAVRPIYWIANIKSNLIDLIVGLGYVGLLALADMSLPVQLLLAVLYAVWLIYIKPKSRRHFMAFQAVIGLFVGLTVVVGYAEYMDVAIVALLGWTIGYAAARHIITSYEEENVEAISLAFGLIIAELTWLAYHWTLATFSIGTILVPQLALIAVIVGFGAYNLYDNYIHATPNRAKARLTIMTCSALIVLLLLTGQWDITI